MALLGRSPQFLCASATIAEPLKHLRQLFGLNFTNVGAETDTSAKYEVEVQLITPPGTADFLGETSDLLQRIATETDSRFITFVDSRKQTEQIASILSRQQDKEEEQEPFFRQDHLERLDVLPFRSGYEEVDRNLIQARLSKGHLRGVVSTSALELGMDIPNLDVAVLVGVPRSATSLYQRIGRIGRHAPGKVLVINTGSVYDEAVFRHPEDFMNRPLAEGALYLENIRIQYIHALCLARNGGENDQICEMLNSREKAEFTSRVEFPEGFLELCKSERLGEVPSDLQSMKAESGEDPHHTFPLRDVESQFRVEFKSGPEQRQLGSLSYGQLMREAYPGAVYYYTARPYRIYRVNVHSKVANARREKSYSSKPQMLLPMVFPNLTPDNVFKSISCGELLTLECNLQVRESICGYKERRGSTENAMQYPIASDGIYFNQPRFTRNYFTSGVVLTHPALSADKVDCELLSELVYEAFLMIVPFERRDINMAVDKHRVTRGPVKEGDKFLALYDQTYGSLRLSGRILEGDVLKRTFELSGELLNAQELSEVSDATRAAHAAIFKCFSAGATDYSFAVEQSSADSASYETVILPGSRGLNITRNNEEFEVEAVFFSPLIQGLSYRGRHVSTTGESVTETVSIKSLAVIPGESRTGHYNYATGELEEFNML
jgi:DEAD/DEAH box helicase domain-containing protein